MDLFEKISIGYTCAPKYYLKRTIDTYTHYFDYIGSSTWSIYRLLKHDFQDHMNQNYFKRVGADSSHRKMTSYVNQKYNLRFVHDLSKKHKTIHEIPEQKWKNFQKKYDRRKTRFLELLSDKTRNLLMIRVEESYHPQRKIFGAIAKDYPSNATKETVSEFEYRYAQKICRLIKEKFQKNNFALIYISTVKENHFDEENQIITLFHKSEIKYNQTHLFDKLFTQNLQLINQSLKKILATK